MSTQGRGTISRRRRQLEYGLRVGCLDGVTRKSTRIELAGRTQSSESPAMECDELRSAQGVPDRLLGKVVPKAQEVPVDPKHPSCNALVDRSRVRLGDCL